ncbi:hypothetical protein [Posidoniimonas corsicana]|uniref:hypothetical protein n=1 Tax=Posidoniimonas corsicana TaxID=1938618 RepID=UPI0011B6EDB2|nr:hypothetical protein [Posidoniimonas corsicana]
MASVLALAMATTADAANIAWVSFHPADDTPSSAAAAGGFTVAPDKGFTDLLASAGHQVTRFVSASGLATSVPPENGDSPAAYLASLNAMDLVIIGRSISSGDYGGTNTEWWNSQVTAPVMLMSGYATRSNRLNYTVGDHISDISGPTSLEAVDLSHPVFDGMSLNGVNLTPPVLDVAPGERGASINADSIVAGGRLIARIPGDDGLDDTQPGAPVIAEWPAGAVLGNGDITAGRRMMFIAGSREAPPASGHTAGVFDLTVDGQTLFLNAVDYMTTVPEPTSAALVLGTILAAGVGRWRG